MSGNPLLVGTGTLVTGSPTSIDLFFAAPSAFMGILASVSSTPVNFKGGTELWVQMAIQDLAAIAGVSLSNAIMGVVL